MSGYVTTPNYGLRKPLYNADDDQWGNDWNFNADEIDAVLKTNATAAAACLPLAGGTLTGPLGLAADPTSAPQAATKRYVDSLGTAVGSTFLPLTGGNLTGALGLAGDPSSALQAATKRYVDTFLPLAGGTLTGPLALAADPTLAPQAATKRYVDGAVGNYLPLAGGNLTGSLGVAVAIPTAPAPFVPTLFTQSESSGEFLINSYQSAANSWVYKAAGFAARIGIDTNGALTFAAAPTGAAAGALVWTANRLRIDPQGNLLLGAYTLPSDSTRINVLTQNLTLPLAGFINWNCYQAGGPSKTIAAGYSALAQFTSGAGSFILSLYPTLAAGASLATVASSLTLDQTGALSVTAGAAGGRLLVQGTGNTLLSATSTTGGDSYSMAALASGDLLFYFGATAGALTTALFAYQNSNPGNFFWNHTPTAVQWFWMRASDKLIYNALAAVGGLTAYVVTSDERTKDVTAALAYGLPEINRLNPIRFHRVGTPDDQFELGFSAQEMQLVIPEAVRAVGFGQVDDPGLDVADPTLGVLESSVIPVLVRAMQSIDQRLAAVESLVVP